MEIKTLEIRDRGTFIPAIALKPWPRNESERYLWARAGYGREAEHQNCYTLVGKLVDEKLSYDPHSWSNRTMTIAHIYINDHWEEIKNGQVIDVEFILGETSQPKESERNGQ